MTNVSAKHVTDVDIDRFCRQEMPATMMVAFTDHLADCGECRRRGEDRSDAAAAGAKPGGTRRRGRPRFARRSMTATATITSPRRTFTRLSMIVSGSSGAG